MYCIKCGAYLDDSATFCPKCGTNVTQTTPTSQAQPIPSTDQNYQSQVSPTPQQFPPSSNLVWGILTTIFCCLPLGIVSIVYASKVEGLWASGNYNEARAAARKAGTWAMWSAISVAIIFVLYIILAAILAGSGHFRY